MRKDDLLMKERLTKLAILDTLLAKNQPLTEAEEVVKNKLLALKWDDIATASHLFQRIIVGIHQTVDTALQKSSSVGTKKSSSVGTKSRLNTHLNPKLSSDFRRPATVVALQN
ncbi:hypothetical protein F2Q70_00014966 [Brassica cretica]|uniref:Uncharacterized protein n=1 Tax=Brassica cretica TaxID=69181 RepID=A0A8S9HY88_BRACR|nr:hypothetical protein F2Q70_00014966 [Brassica cretica]